MYNNFSSKKTKKVISALLATALVATATPITADAATAKTVGVGKTITYNAGAKVKKVTVKNKKIVTAKKSGKKVTLKGKKAGKTTVTVKTTKKTIKLTVKVGATSITKKTVATSMTTGTTKKLKVNAVNGKGDTIKFTSSKKAVVKVNTASVTAKSNKVATTTVTAVKAGTAKITATSKYTGKSKTFTIKVTDPTVTPEATTGAAIDTTPSVAPDATTPATNPGENQGGTTTNAPQTTTGASTTAPNETENPDVTTNPAVTGDPSATDDANATQDPSATETPAVDVTTAPAVTSTPSVVSLSAVQTGRQTITVTGTDLSDEVADYTVKRGNSTISIASVEVSEDKTTAVLTSASSALAAGDYTVTYGDESATLSVVAEVATDIVFDGNNLVLTGTSTAIGSTATIAFTVVNQFGETMATSGATAVCGVGTVGVTDATKAKAGTLTVEFTQSVTVGQEVSLTLMVGTLFQTTTVTVASQAVLSTITVKGIYDMSDSENPIAVDTLTAGDDASDYAILFTAQDQYGKEITSVTTDDITLSSNTSSIGVTTETFGTATLDSVTYLTLPLSGTLTAGTGYVNLITAKSLTPTYATVNITVKEAVGLASISLNPVDTLYVGTKTEMEYTVLDTNGDTVTDYKTLSTIAINNSADFTWERQSDGTAKLYYTPSSDTVTTTLTGTSKTTVFLSSSSVNTPSVTSVDVYAQKTCTSIVGLDSDVATAALVGGETLSFTTADLQFNDQYGNLMTDDEVKADYTSNNTDISIQIQREENSTGFATTYDTAETVALSEEDIFSTTTDADTAGTSTYTLTLYDGTTKISNSDTQIQLKSTTIDKVTNLTLAAIPTMYVGEDGVSTADITVTGKLGNLTVAIPASQLTVSVDSTYFTVNENKTQLTTISDAYTNLYDSTKNEYTDVTSTVKVTINNTDGTVLSQDVVLSAQPLKVAKVTLKENTSFAYAVTGTAVTATGASVAVSDITDLLELTDQYENTNATIADEAATPIVKFTNLPSGVTVSYNNTENAELIVTGTKDTVYNVGVTLTYPSGVTYTNTLVITLEVDA